MDREKTDMRKLVVFSCNIPVVLDNYGGAGVVQSNTTNTIWCSNLLIRLHISVLSLGHHQVTDSNWRRLYSVLHATRSRWWFNH